MEFLVVAEPESIQHVTLLLADAVRFTRLALGMIL